MKKSPPECERPQNKPASQLQMAPHPHGRVGILIGVTAPRETSQPPEKYAPPPLPAGTLLSSVGLQRECPKNKNIHKKSGTLQKRFDIAGRTIYSSLRKSLATVNLLNCGLYFQEKHTTYIYTKCSVYFEQFPRISKSMDLKRECPYLGKERN